MIHIRVWLHRLQKLGKIGLLVGLLALLLVPEWPRFTSERYRLDQVVGQRTFDFWVWELEAIGVKVTSLLANGPRYLDEAQREAVVRDYLALIGEANRLEANIRLIYTDPDVADPAAATAELQAELAATRQALARKGGLAEAIIQEQVADILVEEGFGFLGQAWPPVWMRMTPLPSLLVVSPRDRIERAYAVPLEHGLSTAVMEQIETAVESQLEEYAALIVPIGGMATYPAMIMETSNLHWLIKVTAHEWAHHWLTFFPLGWYYSDPDVRIINETVASLVDQELRDRVLLRYYPDDYIPPPPEPPDLPETAPLPDPPAFDFRAEMAETRVRVDELLAAGEVEEAEAYMEARRLFFLENGYRIRKLNQAYFAFYGAYAAQPGGAAGIEDPIGPRLRDIRAHSPSLRVFMERVAPIDSLDKLIEVWQQTTKGE